MQLYSITSPLQVQHPVFTAVSFATYIAIYCSKRLLYFVLFSLSLTFHFSLLSPCRWIQIHLPTNPFLNVSMITGFWSGLSLAPPWSWAKPRRWSANSSPWAKAAQNSRWVTCQWGNLLPLSRFTWKHVFVDCWHCDFSFFSAVNTLCSYTYVWLCKTVGCYWGRLFAWVTTAPMDGSFKAQPIARLLVTMLAYGRVCRVAVFTMGHLYQFFLGVCCALV